MHSHIFQTRSDSRFGILLFPSACKDGRLSAHTGLHAEKKIMHHGSCVNETPLGNEIEQQLASWVIPSAANTTKAVSPRKSGTARSCAVQRPSHKPTAAPASPCGGCSLARRPFNELSAIFSVALAECPNGPYRIVECGEGLSLCGLPRYHSPLEPLRNILSHRTQIGSSHSPQAINLAGDIKAMLCIGRQLAVAFG